MVPRGGRAKASQQQRPIALANHLENKEALVPVGKFSSGWSQVVGSGENQGMALSVTQASKTRIKTKDCSGSKGYAENVDTVGSAALPKIAAAAGLDPLEVEGPTIRYWISAGADLDADILPMINRLRERELKRSGQAPFHLAYYSAAILEARSKRIGADVAGASYAKERPPSPQSLKFDLSSCDHWRQFLGDRTSRFRGEYLSQHWHIPAGHPVFAVADLGPDPCHRFNPKVPTEIYEEYGVLWSWRPPANAQRA